MHIAVHATAGGLQQQWVSGGDGTHEAIKATVRAAEIRFMTYTPRRPIQRRPMGSTLNRPGRVRLLLEGKLNPPRWGSGSWWGTAYDWCLDCSFRVCAPEWLPTGSVLVCDHRADVDRFIVNVEQTAAENGFPDDWRDHQPGSNAPTIPLLGI